MTETTQKIAGKPSYVWLSWISPPGALVIYLLLMLAESRLSHLSLPQDSEQGLFELRAFFYTLFVASIVCAIVGFVSLIGIRSRKEALWIIPVTILGLCGNYWTALLSLMEVAFWSGRFGPR